MPRSLAPRTPLLRSLAPLTVHGRGGSGPAHDHVAHFPARTGTQCHSARHLPSSHSLQARPSVVATETARPDAAFALCRPLEIADGGSHGRVLPKATLHDLPPSPDPRLDPLVDRTRQQCYRMLRKAQIIQGSASGGRGQLMCIAHAQAMLSFALRFVHASGVRGLTLPKS